MFETRFDELVDTTNKINFDPYCRKWFCVVFKDPFFGGKIFREYLQGSSKYDMLSVHKISEDSNPNLVSITEVYEIPLLYRPVYLLYNGIRYLLSCIRTEFGSEILDNINSVKDIDSIPTTINFVFTDRGELTMKVEVNPLGIDLIIQP